MQNHKTFEEYKAAAMLMGKGWTFDVITHCFEDENMNVYLDADTLEQVFDDSENRTLGEYRQFLDARNTYKKAHNIRVTIKP